MKIYHNPRCRKSRETLALLNEAGITPEIVEYLKTPLTKAELEQLIDQLGIEPEKLVRKGEVVYKELLKGKDLSREEWIENMVKYPILIERPIVTDGKRSVIGRPPENVRELI